MGSGSGSVGRADVANTRSPQFESSRRQHFIFTVNHWKDENKKEDGNGTLKISNWLSFLSNFSGFLVGRLSSHETLDPADGSQDQSGLFQLQQLEQVLRPRPHPSPSAPWALRQCSGRRRLCRPWLPYLFDASLLVCMCAVRWLVGSFVCQANNLHTNKRTGVE